MFGVGCISILTGVWNWATGPVPDAHEAFHRALDQAKEAIRQQAHAAGTVGVLGVEVDLQLSYHRYTVVLTGTAVRPYTDETGRTHFNVQYRTPFLCDLSARDFVVLSSSGWFPLDLVAGVSYVHAPRRTLGTAIGQSTQNVELTNYTETLYQAREAAMEELQSHITQTGGTGLVDAKIIDRPVYFAQSRRRVPHVRYGHQNAGQGTHTSRVSPSSCQWMTGSVLLRPPHWTRGASRACRFQKTRVRKEPKWNVSAPTSSSSS